ncbi:MAG: cyclic nucleotide-binding domain-containing protein [Candidatus Bipolaricaulota bacterium]
MEKESIALLKQVPLFARLGDKHVQAIARSARELKYPAGKPIVREGDQSNAGFYLILDGQVEVRRGDQVLAKLGSGQFFGEMAVLDGEPRSADVYAVSDTTCLGLTSWDVKALTTTYPDIAMGIISELARRLRQTSMKLSE